MVATEAYPIPNKIAAPAGITIDPVHAHNPIAPPTVVTPPAPPRNIVFLRPVLGSVIDSLRNMEWLCHSTADTPTNT